MRMMDAIVKPAAAPGLELRQVPVPTPGAGDVLITGAGPVGILAVAIAKYAGTRRVVVTDLNDYRLGLALKMGADAAINSAKPDLTLAMKEQGLVEGFDVGFEMSGSGAALHQMIGVMRNGGKISLLGLGNGPVQMDMNLVIG